MMLHNFKLKTLIVWCLILLSVCSTVILSGVFFRYYQKATVRTSENWIDQTKIIIRHQLKISEDHLSEVAKNFLERRDVEDWILFHNTVKQDMSVETVAERRRANLILRLYQESLAQEIDRAFILDKDQDVICGVINEEKVSRLFYVFQNGMKEVVVAKGVEPTINQWKFDDQPPRPEIITRHYLIEGEKPYLAVRYQKNSEPSSEAKSLKMENSEPSSCAMFTKMHIGNQFLDNTAQLTGTPLRLLADGKIIAGDVVKGDFITGLFPVEKNIAFEINFPIANAKKDVRNAFVFICIASGHLDTALSTERKDEIGQLACDIDKMRLAIKEMTENLKEQERLKSEMELARKIQTVLLPKNPVISGYEIAVSMNPAEEVGGDYYDVISVGGFDWIVIGDVSGHGVTAGLVMMMVQTSIHTVLLQNPETPTSELLSVVNRAIYENLVKMDESKHMTIVVLACGKDGFFDFSGLHDDMLLWCADTRKVETIETDGMWIGLEPDISEMLDVDAFKMEKGDCLVLYSDGITEAWGKDRKMFGSERLISVVEKFGDRSVSEIHAAIMDALSPYDKSDDVTLLVMKRV